jgi:hypothetical protein
MTPLVGRASEPTSAGPRRGGGGGRMAGARGQNRIRENYGDSEISRAASGDFAHAIGPRAPIEMKPAQ